jgi:endogenous inhibitor of DNA gyrase (YacG/DUF329 family)
MADLGRWLGEEYRVPEDVPEDERDSGRGRDTRNAPDDEADD